MLQKKLLVSKYFWKRYIVRLVLKARREQK